eukprot:923550-Pleurochrysis_carterae.AAC.1
MEKRGKPIETEGERERLIRSDNWQSTHSHSHQRRGINEIIARQRGGDLEGEIVDAVAAVAANLAHVRVVQVDRRVSKELVGWGGDPDPVGCNIGGRRQSCVGPPTDLQPVETDETLCAQWR